LNLRPHRPEAPDINLTPLIDVVFLLLIFFMVSTTFRDDGRLPLRLPEADAKPIPADQIELTEVVIERGGRISIDSRAVVDANVESLKQALVDAVGVERNRPLLIKADARVTHEVVMRVLDAAGQLGLSQIAFAATQPGRAGSSVVQGREHALSGPASAEAVDADSVQAPGSEPRSAPGSGTESAGSGVALGGGGDTVDHRGNPAGDSVGNGADKDPSREPDR
jgi:biopolymer transport protein ExbD